MERRVDGPMRPEIDETTPFFLFERRSDESDMKNDCKKYIYAKFHVHEYLKI